MPNISIYLPNDLYELVKADPSKIVQAALRQSISPNKPMAEEVKKSVH